MLGLKRGVLALQPYAPAWPDLYRQEALQLRALLDPHIVDIQHVGSTSIPGMLAKPILDIAIQTASLSGVAHAEKILPSHGYVYRGEQGIPNRHLFAKNNPITHHVHMMLPHCDNWQHQLLFRDYLLAFPETANQYAALKRQLFETVDGDRRAYSDGKKTFIKEVLDKAKAYFEQSNCMNQL